MEKLGWNCLEEWRRRRMTWLLVEEGKVVLVGEKKGVRIAVAMGNTKP